MFHTTLVFAAIVATQAPGFARLPFALSWWALSFPVAALSLACFAYGAAAGLAAYVTAGFAALALLVAIVAYLVARTILAILRGEICLPE